MFTVSLNGKEREIREWYVGPDNSYLKFIDTTFDEISEFIPDNSIITSIIIKDMDNLQGKEQRPYTEEYTVYLDKKSVHAEIENINVVTKAEDGATVVQNVDKMVFTVTLGKPFIDKKVDSIADYVGYIENPDSLSLKDYKKYAVKASKDELELYLLTHPLESEIHGSEKKNYSISENKQILLLMEINMATAAKEQSISYQPSWNASGEVCEPWTLEELVSLSFEMVKVVKPLVSYQQSLEEQILSKGSIEEIKSIKFDFEGNDPRNKKE